MNGNSHKQQILAYLQSGKSITPNEAWANFGCYRLGARILELRQAGHDIKTTMRRSYNTHRDRVVRFAEYSLQN